MRVRARARAHDFTDQVGALRLPVLHLCRAHGLQDLRKLPVQVLQIWRILSLASTNVKDSLPVCSKVAWAVAMVTSCSFPKTQPDNSSDSTVVAVTDVAAAAKIPKT